MLVDRHMTAGRAAATWQQRGPHIAGLRRAAMLSLAQTHSTSTSARAARTHADRFAAASSLCEAAVGDRATSLRSSFLCRRALLPNVTRASQAQRIKFLQRSDTKQSQTAVRTFCCFQTHLFHLRLLSIRRACIVGHGGMCNCISRLQFGREKINLDVQGCTNRGTRYNPIH